MDYQKMWFLLKEYLRTKNSHGKNELLEKMIDLEIRQAIGEKKENEQ